MDRRKPERAFHGKAPPVQRRKVRAREEDRGCGAAASVTRGRAPDIGLPGSAPERKWKRCSRQARERAKKGRERGYDEGRGPTHVVGYGTGRATRYSPGLALRLTSLMRFLARCSISFISSDILCVLHAAPGGAAL